MKHLAAHCNKALLFLCVYFASSYSEIIKQKDIDPELKSKTTVSRHGTKIIDVSSNNCKEILGYQMPPDAFVLSTYYIKTMYGLIIFVFYDDIKDISGELT